MAMADVWTDRLSEYIDEELTPAERTSLEAHLTSCAACRDTIVDLRAVAERARHLPARPPASDLWPTIEPRLSPLRFAAGGRRKAEGGKRFSFSMPQLIAAGLALMVMSGGGMWVLLNGGRATSMPPVAAVDPISDPRMINAGVADQRYDEAIQDLQQALEAGRAQLDPTTVLILEANLKTIDAAIEDARRALAADAENVYLNNHLADARQRKLALLRRATALVGGKT
jgi:tetratricopeptide (TPR) repeat protein